MTTELELSSRRILVDVSRTTSRLPDPAGGARLVSGGLIVAGVIVAATTWWTVVSCGCAGDAHAYWTASYADPYARAVLGGPDAYHYSPAFLEVLAPLRALPWTAFLGAWTAAELLALWLLAGPLGLLLAAVDPVHLQITQGNVELFMALAIVVGFRLPAAWVFVLLTKVTPGVGLLWFVVRREWRHLAQAIGATGCVVALSLLLAPSLWPSWIEALHRESGQSFDWLLGPLPLRIAAAAVLIAVGARTNRRWTVPVGATLALPLLWPTNLVMLLGVVPCLRAVPARGPADSFLHRGGRPS